MTPSGTTARPGRTCYLPDWLLGRRAWGISAQLYELRSQRNWGIGDFTDLASLCEIAAAAGADFVGVNPLHALFLAEPERCSPFSPSNRRFLNPLCIAVDRVTGFDPAMADDREIERLRREPLVDYAGVATLKLAVLRQIWRAGGMAGDEELRAFQAEGDTALQHHAVFEALSLRMKAEGRGSGWRAWPRSLSRVNSPAVAAFAEENADEVAFHVWLQRLARRQLAEAANRAHAAGMRISLYLDLAVGEALDGSATWSDPALFADGVRIGAPPDLFSVNGQDWRLAPLSPQGLARDGFQPYRTLLEAGMRDAGALRIDHAMSLKQLFWIPEGRDPAEGVFVPYPAQDLVDALAEASQSSHTIVVGEDLGHVPEGFREEMAEAGILSYRILYFERRGARFRAPRAWPALALACLSTHDLPTLKGWWAGSDVAMRLEHGLIDAQGAARQARERKAERKGLLRALAANGVLRPTLSQHRRASFGSLAVATHRFIARTPSRLACVRLADAVGEEHPTNMPGVSDGYPNWRRKLAVGLESLPALPLFRAVTAAMARERPR